MLTVTQEACKELDAYFDGKEKAPIRVYLASGGCSGSRLALALDNPMEEDKTFDESGYTFCINTELLDAAQSIKIDCSSMGFVVDSEIPLSGGGCSSCGGGCGSH